MCCELAYRSSLNELYPHSMAQTHQLDGGNNIGATTVTMPMQSEGKEVSGIMTMMLVQQGG